MLTPRVFPVVFSRLLVGASLALGASAGAAEDDCKVETKPGVFVSCQELLDRAGAAKGAGKVAPKPPQPAPVAPTPKPRDAATTIGEGEFAKDLSPAEAARLRDTEIDWSRGRKPKATADASSLAPRGLAVLRDAQADTSPLGLERARVDRLKATLFELERTQKPWEKRKLVDLRLEVKRALKSLSDIERLALGVMQSCRYGKGLTTSIKTVKMTASGPVKLSDAEIRAQAAGVDDPICARNTLVTQEQVDDVNEMHRLKNEIEDNRFGYWSRTKLRAAQDRIALLKQKHFGYKRSTEDIREVDRVPHLERTNEGRRSVGSGENKAKPLNARDSKARH